MPLMGMPAGTRTPAAVTPKRPLDGRTSGSARRGTPKQVAQLGGPLPCVPMSKSIVRLALRGSVAMTAPPVRFHSSQESIVPRARSRVGLDAALGQQPLEPWCPRSRGRGRARSWSAPASRCPARGSSSQRPAVRRSCQTMARWRGPPVRRSHATSVSRWSVMPMAATGSSRSADELGQRRRHRRPRSRRRRARPSPGRGKCWVNSRYAIAGGAPVLVDGERRGPRWSRRRAAMTTAMVGGG